MKKWRSVPREASELAVTIKVRDVMQCPKCKLENPSGTTWCDCGYNFSTGEVSKKTSSEPRKDFSAAAAAAWLSGKQRVDSDEYF
jgi:hypothetical protein